MRAVLCGVIAFSLLASGLVGRSGAGTAAAQASERGRGKKEVEAKTVLAMERFDLLEFETAKMELGDAVVLARKYQLDDDPVLARVYLNLGIVEFAGLKNQDAALLAFVAAVTIDPDIQIGVAYRTEAMSQLLTTARKGAPAGVRRRAAAEPGGQGADAGSAGDEVSRIEEGAADRAAARKIGFVSLAAGTGGGYISGSTEVVGSDVDCCFAPAFFHLFPELGFYLSPRLSLSAAFRMGFAIGANVPGHASFAPSGLLRLRYGLAGSGSGLQLSASAGGGVIRHTVKVEQAAAGMDTDTAASGPFLAGCGLGYLVPISRSMRLSAELNALAAIPGGIEEVGPCPGSGCVRPQFAVQMDLNLGVLFAF